MKKSELPETINSLLSVINLLCEKAKSQATFLPQNVLYFKRTIQNFKYDDSGVHYSGYNVKRYFKKLDINLKAYVNQEITKTIQYKKSISQICKIYGLTLTQCKDFVFRLIYVVLYDIINQKSNFKSDFSIYVENFIKDLDQEEIEYTTKAYIKGITLQTKLVHLDENTLIRQVERTDLEFDHEAELSSPQIIHVNTPSAVLELITRIKSGQLFDPFPALHKAVIILSLFDVGGIEFIEYESQTSSFFPNGCLSSRSIRLLKSGQYLLKEGEGDRFINFWSLLKTMELPMYYLGNQREPNELTIAYDRYSDSLEGGTIEKRISNAVMGLESLFLSGSEQQEMSYRLRLRVGKLLGLLGYNARDVKDRVKDAYEIRSVYVHGSLISKKDKLRYKAKYGDLNDFMKTIISYLRASIVALLSRPNKTVLIQTIDDSFLDNESESQIKDLLFIPY